MRIIYLDNAATTRVDPKVFRVMKPFFFKKYGNASEFHILGREARAAIEKARARVAKFLKATPSEVIFTSCATESINLSHKGLVEELSTSFKKDEKPQVITCSIEHKAVLEVCRHLEENGLADVNYLKVDKFGQIRIEDLKRAITSQTVLISIGYVNNEVGTIQPIEEIGRLIKGINKNRKRKIYFHTDATQAIKYLNVSVLDLCVDFLSFTGHKINAPKGIGVLYKRTGVEIVRQTDGGGQEGRLRAGTENVPYIVGIGKAIELIKPDKKVGVLCHRLIQDVLKIKGVKLTGHPTQRVPHIASFIVDGVEGEAMVLALSDLGVIASSGSACTSGDLRPSHVLAAMGIPPEKSHGSLRLSLDKNTTLKDIDFITENLPEVVKKLRLMSPVGNKYG